MNTFECSACEQYQLSGTAHACPHCGHFTFVETSYEGSESDYEVAQQEESFSYHLSALEDDIPQEYGGQTYY